MIRRYLDDDDGVDAVFFFLVFLGCLFSGDYRDTTRIHATTFFGFIRLLGGLTTFLYFSKRHNDDDPLSTNSF